eukprot:INCI14297.1.p1 GENE.INCI14297.1~~INCI14297.1.p1  ORF type:complete len:1030 (-),score=253.03 INCI14297.1:126-2837(-)
MSAEALSEAARQDEERRRRQERGGYLGRDMQPDDVAAMARRFEEQEKMERENQAIIRAAAADQTARGRRPPNIDDPRLYVVKVKPGKEADTVMRVTNKIIYQLERGVSNNIISVFSRGTKGRICIEALSSDYAKAALQGLDDVYVWSVEELEIADMIPMVRPVRTKVVLRKGDWVRYRRRGTVYKKDLAQIFDVSRGGDVLILKMVPRIDYSQRLLTSGDAPSAALAQTTGIRPAQKLFKRQEVVIHHGPDAAHDTDVLEVHKFHNRAYTDYTPRLPNGEEMPLVQFNGLCYTPDGFLLLEAVLREVITKEVAPEPQEVAMFRARRAGPHAPDDEDDDGGGDEGVSSAARVQKQIDRLLRPGAVDGGYGGEDDEAGEEMLSIGDRVVVAHGELARMDGTIVSIEKGTLGKSDTQIGVRPSAARFGTAVWKFLPMELRKQYKVGDHVKIRVGRDAGESGTIIKIDATDVENQIAVLLSDLSKQEYVAPCRHLQLTKEVAQGLKSLQGYRLYDLVRVGRNEVGVIIEVGREHLRVVLQDGSTKKIAPSEVLSQLNMQSKRATQMTHNRDTIAVDESVRVISGDYEGTVAVIKHIHKAFLFLYSKTSTLNGGIIVVKARQVEINGTRSSDPVQTLLAQGYQVPGFPRSRFHILKLKEHNKRSEAQFAESLQGKKVRVIAGKYKGRLGHVSNVRQDMCFVGLTSLAKKFSIHKDSLVVAEPHKSRQPLVPANAGRAYASGEGITAGEETGMVVATPMLSGDRTPMVIDSAGEDGEDDPWDPDAAGYDEFVTWAFQGVVVTVDGFGDDRWVLCEDATEKYDDERVEVRPQLSGQTRMVELSKLHAVTPSSSGPVIIISGDRAGQQGTIDGFDQASALQTVSFAGQSGAKGSSSIPLDELAVYDPNNRP